MEVSRIRRGRIELKRERVALAAIVQSAVETSRPLLEAAGHQLGVHLPDEAIVLEADPVRLAQVLTNLLNNAAKYTDPGGRIWLSARREVANLVLSVRDNGVGIPPEQLPTVFDLFSQADRSYGRSQGGLGIGLTLVRELVELHDGSVEARSDGPGKGSQFIVRLPLPDEARMPLAERRSGEPARDVSHHRVLVVDDNRDAADSLAALISLRGADVGVAHDGAAALEALASERPGLVLLDIGMPGMDGYEVARRMRACPEGRDVTLVALTGWGQSEDRRRSESAGFDAHLVKPVELEELDALLAATYTAAG
jgi:CheY-like chemotaxis protein